MVYCPNCISFEVECDVHPQDYEKPCDYYEPISDQRDEEKKDKEKA